MLRYHPYWQLRTPFLCCSFPIDLAISLKHWTGGHVSGLKCQEPEVEFRTWDWFRSTSLVYCRQRWHDLLQQSTLSDSERRNCVSHCLLGGKKCVMCGRRSELCVRRKGHWQVTYLLCGCWIVRNIDSYSCVGTPKKMKKTAGRSICHRARCYIPNSALLATSEANSQPLVRPHSAVCTPPVQKSKLNKSLQQVVRCFLVLK